LCAAVALLLHMRCVCGVRAAVRRSGVTLFVSPSGRVRVWWLGCSGRKPDRAASVDVAVLLGGRSWSSPTFAALGFTSSGESLDPAGSDDDVVSASFPLLRASS
jgi:hypothetical protein